jgi:hypothetical protein
METCCSVWISGNGLEWLGMGRAIFAFTQACLDQLSGIFTGIQVQFREIPGPSFQVQFNVQQVSEPLNQT